MALKDYIPFLRTKANAPVTDNNLPTVRRWIRYTPLDPTFTNLVVHGYKRNSAAFACMSELAKTFVEPSLCEYKENAKGEPEKVPNSQFNALMKRPNADMGQAEFLRFLITYTALTGNSYTWKEPGAGFQTVGLYPFSDKDIVPIAGQRTQDGLVAYYVLQTEEHNASLLDFPRWDHIPGIAIPKEQIIHWRWAVDPEYPWIGMGALAAAMAEIGMDNELGEYTYSLLKNDATPPLVINLPEGYGGQGGQPLDSETIDRLRAQWTARYGRNSRGAPAFLPHGMEPKQLTFDFQQMQLERLQSIPESRIAAGFGISPMVVGLLVGLQNSTYSNYKEAREALTVQTLIPLWRSLASEFEASFEDEFGTIMFDTSEVEALKANQVEEWTRWGDAWNAGLVKRGEFRAAVGLQVSPEDDVYKPLGGGLMAGLLGGETEEEPPTETEEDDAAPMGETETEGKNFPVGGGGAHTSRSATSAQVRTARRIINQLRKMRGETEEQMIDALDEYFEMLADIASDQLRRGMPVVITFADTVLTAATEKQLLDIFTNYETDIYQSTWAFLSSEMGLDERIGETDPEIQAVLDAAGKRVKDITETTRQALVETLRYGNRNGWSIDDFRYGDGTHKGIIDVVQETYKNRSRAIARTELGTAQNKASTSRYRSAGVQRVIVLDNGFDNSDPVCRRLDRTIQTVEWATRNPLQHPNCVRAFAPVIEGE